MLPLGSAMVIDPMDLMCNHHLTPTRGGMETVNRNLNGATFSPQRGHASQAEDVRGYTRTLRFTQTVHYCELL